MNSSNSIIDTEKADSVRAKLQPIVSFCELQTDRSLTYNDCTMRRLKSFLLILLALWLPIQAAAAVTMPFCRHATEPVAAEATHCHEQGMATVTATNPDCDLGCDNCGLCHLASAGFLLAPSDTLSLHAVSILVPKLITASASHIPEPPQQPPRR